MRRVLQLVALAVVALIVVLLVFNAGFLQHWMAIHLGFINAGPDHYYNFWSGFGSDIGEITVLGAIIGLYRAHNCHTPGCWLLARHTTPEGYKLCRRCIAKPKSSLGLHEIHEDHQL